MVIFFFSACQQQGSYKKHQETTIIFVDESDLPWLTKFVEDFFLKESILYTLFGDKPMSEILLTFATKEEWIDSVKDFPNELSNEIKEKHLAYIEERFQRFTVEESWAKWLNWISHYPDSPFRFKLLPTDEEKLFSAYVIHVPNTIDTLRQHYAIFATELNKEFDPESVVKTFGEPSDPFWKEVLANHYLKGILYGFGKENAYAFAYDRTRKSYFEEQPFFIEGLEEMVLPRFRSNIHNDPMIAHY